jgi:hypothetical protein
LVVSALLRCAYHLFLIGPAAAAARLANLLDPYQKPPSEKDWRFFYFWYYFDEYLEDSKCNPKLRKSQRSRKFWKPFSGFNRSQTRAVRYAPLFARYGVFGGGGYLETDQPRLKAEPGV